MRPFRFLHTADLHLGTPFQGLSRQVPEDWWQRLQAASFQVFARIVDIAIRERVDFVAIAGDLFDSEQAPMAVRFELRRGFERLAAHGVPVFVCHGNHDPLAAPAPLAWPDNVTVFPAAPVVPPAEYRAPSAWLDLAGVTRVQVSGFSYGQQELRAPMARVFQRDPSADFAVALYHGTVGSSGWHANYCPAPESELVARGFDYWALGHIHQPAVLRPHHPTIAYAGNPQGRHRREQGPRGCWLVDVDGAGTVRTTFVETAAVRWGSVDVDVDGAADLAEVRDRTARALQAAAAGGACLVELAWHGATPVHRHLLDAENRRALVDEACAGIESAVFVVGDRVCTTPSADLDLLRESAEFIGELLRLVDEYRQDAGRVRAELAPHLADVFHAGNGLDPQRMADDELLDLLDEAERLVLQYVGAREVAP